MKVARKRICSYLGKHYSGTCFTCSANIARELQMLPSVTLCMAGHKDCLKSEVSRIVFAIVKMVYQQDKCQKCQKLSPFSKLSKYLKF